MKNADGGIPLAQAATFFYDTLEKHYPNYPDVRSIKLIEKEMVRLLKSIFFRYCLLIIVKKCILLIAVTILSIMITSLSVKSL